MGGWYDNYVESDLATFWRCRSKKRGASQSSSDRGRITCRFQFAGVSFRTRIGRADSTVATELVRALAAGTRPVADYPQAPVRIFVMGANRWRDEQEWPLARELGRLLVSRQQEDTGRRASEMRARSSTPMIRAILRPRAEGPFAAIPKVFPWGPMDQRDVECQIRRSRFLLSTAEE